MDDDLTTQAATNVLASEQFGANDFEKQKAAYKIFKNDCNAFTKAVFNEYKDLWMQAYQQNNPEASKKDTKKAWKNHYTDISKNKGEKYFEGQSAAKQSETQQATTSTSNSTGSNSASKNHRSSPLG